MVHAIVSAQLTLHDGIWNEDCISHGWGDAWPLESSFRPFVHLKNSYMDERDVPLYTTVSFKLIPLVSPSWVPKEDFLSGMGAYLSPKPCIQLSKWDQRQLAQRPLS